MMSFRVKDESQHASNQLGPSVIKLHLNPVQLFTEYLYMFDFECFVSHIISLYGRVSTMYNVIL